MEFIDLKAQYRALKDEIDAGIAGVLEHGHYIMGSEVGELERELAAYTGTKYCACCANGTDALQIALMAYGIGPGDAVFVPTFTFMSTAEVVSLVGAEPVFVDILEDTFNMDAESLREQLERVEKEGRLTPRAVIPVDLFGQCADFDSIIPIAREHGLAVIEDGAQGFGGSIGGKKACSFGDISTTSFFPAKPLGCYGDGGAVFTDDEQLYNLICSIRIHGKGSMKYDNIRIGLNSRLDTLQAAVLRPKLRAFAEHELDDRNRWAARYSEFLAGCVKTPTVPNGFVSSWAQYTVLAADEEQRGGLQAALKAAGIPAMIYYVKPLHLQTAFSSLGWKAGSLPVSENVCGRVLSLPMHPYLTEDDVHRVSECILAYLSNRGAQ